MKDIERLRIRFKNRKVLKTFYDLAREAHMVSELLKAIKLYQLKGDNATQRTTERQGE
jgi:hypothetical protein